jgi:class 3 adenylate cyclase/alpha-beta hydrolase superfamily lysophospholipase
MEPRIQYAQTTDGVSIAYFALGAGEPLVVVPGWLSHLQAEWEIADARAFYEALAKRRTVVRLDPRGTGLSDWEAPDVSVEGRRRDVEAVVDALGLERMALLGMSHGGQTAATYASMHPEKVSHLITYGSYSRIRLSLAGAAVLIELVRTQWGLGSAALTAAILPSATPEDAAEFTKLQRRASSGEAAARTLEAILHDDVEELLKKIEAPTLVVHRQDDPVHPIKLAKELASLIPGARIVPLKGDTYPPWLGDSAAVLTAVLTFLGEEDAPPETRVPQSTFRTVLFTDVEGSTALTDRLGDAMARELLREHERMVREALKSHGGSEVKALGDGFMTSFSSAVRALECAIAMQRAFAQRNESAEEPILVRVGLNAGEPIAEGDDLYGTAVNLAARITAQGKGGEILASEAVRQIVAGKKFPFSDLGETTLRGFEDRVRVYEVSWRGED